MAKLCSERQNKHFLRENSCYLNFTDLKAMFKASRFILVFGATLYKHYFLWNKPSVQLLF